MSASAHDPWAYMWMAEFVKNAITGQSSTPSANARPGHRYLRHLRCCHTSRPTIASDSRHRPTKRIPIANSQWTISARGCTVPLQVGEQRARDDEREEDTREGDEERRLGDEPPEALAPRVQQRQAVGLENPPDDAGGH